MGFPMIGVGAEVSASVYLSVNTPPPVRMVAATKTFGILGANWGVTTISVSGAPKVTIPRPPPVRIFEGALTWMPAEIGRSGHIAPEVIVYRTITTTGRYIPYPTPTEGQIWPRGNIDNH